MTRLLFFTALFFLLVSSADVKAQDDKLPLTPDSSVFSKDSLTKPKYKKISIRHLLSYKEKFERSLFEKPADSMTNKVMEDKHIMVFRDFIGVKLSVNNDVESFGVDAGNVKYDLSPNTSTMTKLAVNYKFITASYSYALPFFPGNGDNAEKGKTRSWSYGMDLIFRHLFQHISAARTKGYYLDNTKDFFPGWKEGDAYIQFPNLRYLNFKGVTGFVTNAKFSLRALYSQADRQIKSAGTFFPNLSYRYYIISDESSLLEQNSTQRTDNLEFILAVGYLHTFVYRSSYFLSVGLTPGYGILSVKLQTRTIDETVTNNQTNQLLWLQAKATAGYNGVRFYTGISAELSSLQYTQEHSDVQTFNNRAVFNLFVGYRFNVPKVKIPFIDLVKPNDLK